MGETRPSFARYLLENQEKEGLGDDELAYIAGSMFGAGTDTVRSSPLAMLWLTISPQTASAITFIVFTAALNQEAQAKVQEELDVVVRRDRCTS